MPSTLPDLLRSRAETDGDRTAFADVSRAITYAELLSAAERLATGLAHDGVGPGDRVVIALPAGVDWVERLWAVQLLGGAVCAVNPDLPPQTFAVRCALIGPRRVLTPDDPGVPRSGAPPAAEPGPDDTAILQPTSGTSGDPRHVVVTHGNVAAHLANVSGRLRIVEDDVLVAWVPPWHDLGLVHFMIGTVHWGATCHIVEAAVSTIGEWITTLDRVRGTMTAAPDFAFRLAPRLVDPRATDLGALRIASSGGEPVRHRTLEAFDRAFGVGTALLPGYGLAEATLGVASHAPGERYACDAQGNVSVGPALPGVEVRIADDSEILVQGENVVERYLEEPVPMAPGGWLRTGDAGALDDAGRLYVLGRMRAMIKRGGATLAPRELEEAAQAVDAVRIAAAVGVPGSDGGTERVVVVVETAQPPRGGIASDVSAAVREVIGFAPDDVVVADPRSIPITHNGKIRHAALRDLVAAGSIG